MKAVPHTVSGEFVGWEEHGGKNCIVIYAGSKRPVQMACWCEPGVYEAINSVTVPKAKIAIRVVQERGPTAMKLLGLAQG